VITRIVPSYRSDDVSRIYDVIEYYPYTLRVPRFISRVTNIAMN